MENEYNERMYCKAGFQHADLTDCEHVVSQQPNRRFELPADFYSPEAMALRREENRKKYAPHATSRPRLASVANEVWELTSRGGRPTRVDHEHTRTD